MSKMHIPWKVVLVSGSPRRKQLLSTLISDFEVAVPDVDESLFEGETLHVATQRLALSKGRSLKLQFPDCLLIGADTLVGLDEDGRHVVFGKPESQIRARDMLRRLSGRSHLVVTGVALIRGANEHVFTETTEVCFRTLQSSEIDTYVSTGEPLDKAGAYGIQGGAAEFVASIRGPISNVIGLPTELLAAELDLLWKST